MPDRKLRADDYVIEDPPAWLPDPIERWLADLTYREWHAAILSLVAFPIALGWAAGFRPEAVTLTVALLGIAFGLRALPKNAPAGAIVMRRETWYFVVPFTVNLILGYTLTHVL